MRRLLRYLTNTILFVIIWCIPAFLFVGYSVSVNGTRPSAIAGVGGIVAIIISYKLVKIINKSKLWSRLFDEIEEVKIESRAYDLVEENKVELKEIKEIKTESKEVTEKMIDMNRQSKRFSFNYKILLKIVSLVICLFTLFVGFNAYSKLKQIEYEMDTGYFMGTYKYKGNDFTYQQVLKAANNKNMSLDEYTNTFGILKSDLTEKQIKLQLDVIEHKRKNFATYLYLSTFSFFLSFGLLIFLLKDK